MTLRKVVECDVCHNSSDNVQNPDSFLNWSKTIDHLDTASGVNVELVVTIQKSQTAATFEHICKPCGRDIAKAIVAGIINA